MTATETLDALLREVLAHPDDDAVRLVYADALAEAGDARQVQRAEFIRVQVSYALAHPHFSEHQQPQLCVQCFRASLFSDLLEEEFKVPLRKPLDFADDCPYRLCYLENYFGPWVEWDWVRGFVEELRCPAPFWLDHHAALLAKHPIRRVRLTTWPGQPSEDGHSWLLDRGWYGAVAGAARPAEYRRRLVSRVLRLRWPAITFHLPED